jgi:hypothetical protein
MLALLKLLRQHSRIRYRHKEKRKTRRREVTVTLLLENKCLFIGSRTCFRKRYWILEDETIQPIVV